MSMHIDGNMLLLYTLSLLKQQLQKLNQMTSWLLSAEKH